jgi:DNA-binding beta-propeller fold protein YncE
MRKIFANLAAGAAAFGFALAASAAPTVYIPLGSGNQVIAVDAATSRITATYSGVENPHGLVATPDGEFLIAASLKEEPVPAGAPHDTPNSQLFLIHPIHGHVMLTVPVTGWTHHMAVTPDGRYAISTHPTRGYVSVVDLAANKVVRTIATGPAPNYTLLTRDGSRAFVSNSGNGTISEVDIASWTVVRALEGGPGPEHLVFSRDEGTIYVANPRAGVVTAVDVGRGKAIRTFPVGKDAHGLAISDDGRTLFASARGEDRLVAIDIASGARRSMPLSPAPYHLDSIRGAGKVYVSSAKTPTIWVIDQNAFELKGTIALPAGEGHQMAVVQ